MLFHFIRKSFVNQKKALVLMLASVSVGTAMAASLITISFEIEGKVSKELRAFGANIVIDPKIEGLADISGRKRYLRQEDIIKAKTIFWRHNIIGIVPFLRTKAETTFNNTVKEIDIIGTWHDRELILPGEEKIFSAGVKSVSPWWNLNGRWPDSEGEAMIGTSLASRNGISTEDTVFIEGQPFTITGILETGGIEDTWIIMELENLQKIKAMNGKVSQVVVSALTKPMDEFAYRDPETMSQTEYEKWYCTAYVTSISKQLEEVFAGSKATPVWQIALSEGKILSRLKLLIYFLSFTALIASALGVSTTMVTSLLRRTEEIGLMKAVGADSRQIISIFLTEGITIGAVGGVIGYLMSIAVARYIGAVVFNAGFGQWGMLLPVALGSAVIIATTGSILPIKKALHIKPGVVLRGAV
jgi:putative ABC transport system permease protein